VNGTLTGCTRSRSSTDLHLARRIKVRRPNLPFVTIADRVDVRLTVKAVRVGPPLVMKQ